MHQHFCTGCGTRVDPGAAFCTTCGRAVPAPPLSAPSLVKHPGPPPADPPLPRSGRHRVTWWVAAGVALGLGAGVTTWTLMRTDEPGSDTSAGGTLGTPSGSHEARQVQTRAPAIDRGISVLTEPSSEWSLRPDESAEGGGYFERLAGWYSFGEGSPMAGDALLVAHGGRLRGIDPTDGSQRWEGADSAAIQCEAMRSATLCSSSGEASLDSSFSPVSPDTGPNPDVTLTIDGGRPKLVEASGLWLAVAPSGTSNDASLTAHDPQSGDVAFRVDLPASPEVESVGDRSDKPEALVSGSSLYAMWHDTGWVVDLEEQEVTWSGPASYDWIGDAAAGFQVESEGTDTDATTVVRDRSGNPLVSAPGAPWPRVGGYVVAGTVGVGDSLYDVGTGRALWSRHVEGELGWGAGGRTVLDRTDDATVVLDPRTGREMLRLPSEVMVLRTRDALLVANATNSEVAAYDLAGEQRWSRPYAGGTDTFQIADDALLLGGDDQLHGFSWGAAGADRDDLDSEGATAQTDYWTDCGNEPEFTPVAVEAAGGGVEVVVEVTATCPGGNWLYSPDYRITLTSGGQSIASQGEQVVLPAEVASGHFNFQTLPVWVPAEQPSRLRIPFRYEQLGVAVDVLSQAVTNRLVHVACEAGEIPDGATVPATPEGSHATAEEPLGSQEPRSADPATPGPGTASDDAPTDDSAEADALARLQAIAAADQPVVNESMAHRWTPQLSSKKHGLVVSGVRYDYREILAEHLRLRARYPDVRLTFSDDWNYSNTGFWVTVVDQPVDRPAPVLRWCEDHLFAVGDCFAKRIKPEPFTEGNIKMRPEDSSVDTE